MNQYATELDNFNVEEYSELFDSILLEVDRVVGKIKGREVSVLFVGDSKIKEINREYRSKDKVTDVITFAFDDTPGFESAAIGDIVISFDTAKRQALEYGHSLKREMAFLYCHGLLHLLGYDHNTKLEEEKMFGIQEQVLNNLNINR
jgi:probable rRNA maturation factor